MFQRTSFDPYCRLTPPLSNGNIGVQTNALGLGSTPAFMIGVLDLTPEDVTRPARLPDCHAFELWLDDENVQQRRDLVVANTYRQTLDMRRGHLRTTYQFRVGEGTWTVQLVHRVARHAEQLALVSLSLVSSAGGAGRIRYPLRAHCEPTRYPFRRLRTPPPGYEAGGQAQRMTHRWHPGHFELSDRRGEPRQASLSFAGAAKGDGPGVGGAAVLHSNPPLCWQLERSNDELALVAEVRLRPDAQFQCQAFVALARDGAPAELQREALTQASRQRVRGVGAWVKDHEAAWDNLWKADIQIDGDDHLALQARTDLFNLMQSGGADPRWAYPVFGVASPGFCGGIFWDCDVFMYPAILPLQPQFARGVAEFRTRTLAQAMHNAHRLGCEGAKYPWESDLLMGMENHAPEVHPLSDREIHGNAGIALVIWWWFCATGDRHWLRVNGWPVLARIADMFASWARHRSDTGSYGLSQVWCVDEKLGLVDNCLYTNAAAATAMRCAERAGQVLGLPTDSRWQAIADNIFLPTGGDGRWLTHDTAEDLAPWSGALMVHPLQWPVDRAQLRAAIKRPMGWDMSPQAVLAGVAQDPVAMRRYLQHQADHFPNAPFGVRSESPGRDSIPMHTGSGAFLQGWIYGATGLRWGDNGLHPAYSPCIPEGVQSVTFPALTWHNASYAVTATRDGLSMEMHEAPT